MLQRDPFGTASSLSEQDCSRVHNQSVPSLAQLLEIASRSGSLVLFDLHKPPHGHPYSHSYINVTLQVVRAHISSSQVSVQSKKDEDVIGIFETTIKDHERAYLSVLIISQHRERTGKTVLRCLPVKSLCTSVCL